MQSAPARGRQRENTVPVNACPSRCNLHLRGDGNKIRYIISIPATSCNLHPRGDGNFWFLKPLVRRRVAICTREGTATPYLIYKTLCLQVAICTREGTVTVRLCLALNSLSVAICTREGTATGIGIYKNRECRIVAICTREGTATRLCTFQILILFRCNLHPRGDGNLLV